MAESVPVNYTATRGRSLILEKGYRGIAAYSRRIRHCLKGLVLCSNTFKTEMLLLHFLCFVLTL